MENTPAKEFSTWCLCIWGWCVGHMEDAQVVVVYLTGAVLSYQILKIAVLNTRSLFQWFCTQKAIHREKDKK